MRSKDSHVKKASQYKRGELSRDLLRLAGLGVVAGAHIREAIHLQQLVSYLQPEDRAERNKIWNSIRYLERHGDIDVLEDADGHEYIELTNQGKVRFNEDRIWDLMLSTPRQWDQKWRLVLFDFPIQCRTRHAFRSKLEDFGFTMYQRSVFIYPHECREEVHAVAKWYGVEEYVRYIVATEIRDMRHFAKLFDLI